MQENPHQFGRRGAIHWLTQCLAHSRQLADRIDGVAVRIRENLHIVSGSSQVLNKFYPLASSGLSGARKSYAIKLVLHRMKYFCSDQTKSHNQRYYKGVLQ